MKPRPFNCETVDCDDELLHMEQSKMCVHSWPVSFPSTHSQNCKGNKSTAGLEEMKRCGSVEKQVLWKSNCHENMNIVHIELKTKDITLSMTPMSIMHYALLVAVHHYSNKS